MMCRYIIVALSLLITSCIHNPTGDITGRMSVTLDMSGINTVMVDTTGCVSISIKEAGRLDLDKLVGYIEYIPLETNNKSLLGNIDKLIPYNNRFYILDKKQARSVFIFDNMGNHINTIAAIGRGPKEYVSLGNMTVDRYNNEIILLDDSSFALLYYDLEGNFLRREKIGIRMFDFARISKDDFILFSGSAFNRQLPDTEFFGITIGNPTKEIKWKGFKLDVFFRELHIMGSNHFYQNDTCMFYSGPFTNEVYQIFADGNAKLRYRFIFPNGNETLYKNTGKVTFEFISEAIRRDIWYCLGNNFIETDEFMTAGFTKGDKVVLFTYDKTAKEYIATYTSVFPGSGKVIGNIIPVASDGEYLFAVINQSSIMNYKTMLKNGIMPAGWKLPEILSEQQENDNPVIVRYTINTPVSKAYINDITI